MRLTNEQKQILDDLESRIAQCVQERVPGFEGDTHQFFEKITHAETAVIPNNARQATIALSSLRRCQYRHINLLNGLKEELETFIAWAKETPISENTGHMFSRVHALETAMRTAETEHLFNPQHLKELAGKSKNPPTIVHTVDAQLAPQKQRIAADTKQFRTLAGQIRDSLNDCTVHGSQTISQLSERRMHKLSKRFGNLHERPQKTLLVGLDVSSLGQVISQLAAFPYFRTEIGSHKLEHLKTLAQRANETPGFREWVREHNPPMPSRQME